MLGHAGKCSLSSYELRPILSILKRCVLIGDIGLPLLARMVILWQVLQSQAQAIAHGIVDIESVFT